MKDRKIDMILMVAVSILSLVAGLTITAQAADYSIGGGVGVTPDYEGSDDYEAVPIPFGDIRLDNGMFVQLQGLKLKANLIPSSWVEWLRAGPVYNYRSSRSDDAGSVNWSKYGKNVPYTFKIKKGLEIKYLGSVSRKDLNPVLVQTGVSPVGLLKAALLPTVIVWLFFLVLR